MGRLEPSVGVAPGSCPCATPQVSHAPALATAVACVVVLLLRPPPVGVVERLARGSPQAVASAARRQNCPVVFPCPWRSDAHATSARQVTQVARRSVAARTVRCVLCRRVHPEQAPAVSAGAAGAGVAPRCVAGGLAVWRRAQQCCDTCRSCRWRAWQAMGPWTTTQLMRLTLHARASGMATTALGTGARLCVSTAASRSRPESRTRRCAALLPDSWRKRRGSVVHTSCWKSAPF